MSKLISVFACLLLALSAVSLPARAAIIDIYVTSSNDSGPNTLRQAIIDANANDRDNNGTYIHIQLNNNDPIDLVSDLPLISARVITIAGDSAYYPRINGNAAHAMFQADYHVITFVLRNLDLALGQSAANKGGCVHFDSTGYLFVKDVSFFGCEAKGTYGEGGAIYTRGHVQITRSTFYTNYANGDTNAFGGAIFKSATDGQLEIVDSQFNGNRAVATATTGSAGGGAIYSTADTHIEHTALLDNAALTPYRDGASSGGAISVRTSLVLLRSVLISNYADSGGAIKLYRQTPPTQINLDLRNNLFLLNAAETSRGGVVYSNGGIASLRNNTFWHNSAGYDGANFSGSTNSVFVHVSNNLVAGGNGNHDSCTGFTTMNPTTASVYNILPAAECGLGTGPGDQITQGAGIIGLKYDAAEPNQAYVWLVQDSPAVEGAYPGTPDDDDPYACPELDGPGNTRPAQGIGIPGSGPPIPARCDIGAYESPGEAPLFYNSFDDPLHGFQL